MRKMSWGMLMVTGLLALPAAEGGSVDGREHRQRERIREGERSGELTRHEAARLRREQTRVRREERRYRASGDSLSRRERRDLQRDLDRSSRHIRRQKHDGQDR
jgi:hypothetical protein